MTIDRRTFLRLSGALPMVGSIAWPDEDAWERLRHSLAGPLFRPSDPGYPEAKQGFFTLYDDRFPAAVAGAARVEDVQRCVEFAAARGLPIAARCGGHSYPGYSTVDGGLVVELSRMADVRVRPDGSAVVGAGARLSDVTAVLAAAGRVLPAGTCGTVGVTGLALGGGIGVLDRKYGLTCDHLVAARVVTADGCVRTASATSEPDLYWALRGGGGGNFGIVTEFTFRTVPVEDVTTFDLKFPVAAQAALLGAWQEWQPRMPDELWSGMGLGPSAAGLSGTFVGPEARLKPLLDELVRAVGNPSERMQRERSHLEAMAHFDGRDFRGGANPDAAPAQRAAYIGTSRMLMRPIEDPAEVVALLDSSPLLYTIIDAGGGAVGRVGTHETAYPHRRALASFQMLHGAGPADGGEAFARHAVGVVRDGLGPEFGTTGYVNYLDPEMPDWARAYYGTNLGRLRRVTRKYDPEGVFAFPQGLSEPGATVHTGGS